MFVVAQAQQWIVKLAKLLHVHEFWVVINFSLYMLKIVGSCLGQFSDILNFTASSFSVLATFIKR